MPPAGERHACIGVAGLSDGYNTTPGLLELSNHHKQAGTDAECYFFDMGHSRPSEVASVSPAVSWPEVVTEYFLTHPRGFATQSNNAPMGSGVFRDDFDSASPTMPSATRWRVDSFDPDGILYGPTDYSGNPGDGVYGYQFRVEDGYAQSDPIGTGLQGGTCMSWFKSGPVEWNSSFVVDSASSDLTVWPVILRYMDGQVVSLNIEPDGWQWQSAETSLAFRTTHSASIVNLDSGSLSLENGTAYTLEVSSGIQGFEWELSGGGDVYSGVIPFADAPLRSCRVGFGLRGTNAQIKFDYAELGSGMESTAVKEDCWEDYR
jgi:hypothetical protein